MGRTETLPLYSAFARPGETIPGNAQEKQSFLNYIPFVGSKSPSKNSTRASSNASATPKSQTPPTADQQGGNFISKFAKRGVEAASGGVRSVTTGVQQRTEEASFFLNSQRLMFFLFFAGIGAGFMLLAFLFLPMIVFAPQKFALLFTVGSICMIASLGVIKGFTPLLAHVSAKERLPFSVAYCLSLLFTLYASLWAHSYILTFLSATIQLVALLSLLISYVPGGVRFLSFVKGQGVGAAKSMVPGFSKQPAQGQLPV